MLEVIHQMKAHHTNPKTIQNLNIFFKKNFKKSKSKTKQYIERISTYLNIARDNLAHRVQIRARTSVKTTRQSVQISVETTPFHIDGWRCYT